MFGAVCGHGYLPRYAGPHPSLWACPIGRHLPTRWEEYAFAVETLEHLPMGSVLDAGCGANASVHALPVILGNMKRTVTGLDRDPEVLLRERHPHVTWVQGDMTNLPFERGSFDYYCAISVLEHLPPDDYMKALEEAHRVLKPSGSILVTMDWMPAQELAYVLRLSGFEPGNEMPVVGEHLNPTVAWARAAWRNI